MDLVEWLRAQLDEDERLARAAMRVNPFGLTLCLHLPPEVQQHNDRHDPARVLREVEAKRRILDLHAEPHECPVWDELIGGDPVTGYLGGDEPCPTVRLLALPCSDRPGYREEWRP